MSAQVHTISERFGPDWLQPQLVSRFPHALRLDLGQQRRGIDRMISAVQTSVRVVQRLFDGAEGLTLAVHIWWDPEEGAFVPLRRTFRSMQVLGLPRPRLERIERLPDDHGFETSSAVLITEIGLDLVQRVAWGCCAADLGVKPALWGDALLISLDLGVLVHIYDDRGMDVVSLDPDRIADLATHFPELKPRRSP